MKKMIFLLAALLFLAAFVGSANGEAAEAIAPLAASGSATEQETLDFAKEIVELMQNMNWNALGGLVHPTQGVTFSPYGYIDTDTAVTLGMDDVKGLGEDDSPRVWGVYDGSGEPIALTFADYYDRFIMSRDFTQAPQSAVDRVIQSGMQSNLYVLGNGGTYVELHFPSGSEDGLDWQSLRLVFSWYEGDDAGHAAGLYVVGIVHDEWTI